MEEVLECEDFKIVPRAMAAKVEDYVKVEFCKRKKKRCLIPLVRNSIGSQAD